MATAIQRYRLEHEPGVAGFNQRKYSAYLSMRIAE